MTATLNPSPAPNFKRWLRLGCGWLYDEALGDQKHGLAPGTRWVRAYFAAKARARAAAGYPADTGGLLPEARATA